MLRLEARFAGTPKDLSVFRPKAKREAAKGWHFAHLAPEEDAAEVLKDLEKAHR